MEMICNHAGDYRHCSGCEWAKPWGAGWELDHGKGMRLLPAPFPIFRLIAPTRAFPVPHSPLGNCPHAKGIYSPIRLLEVS